LVAQGGKQLQRSIPQLSVELLNNFVELVFKL